MKLQAIKFHHLSTAAASCALMLGNNVLGAIASPSQSSSSFDSTVSPIPRPTAQPQNLVASGYVLGAGDQVDITVLDYQEFTGSRVILSDGTITLPVIGSVMAANRSPNDLAQELTQQLRPFLRNPVVTVAVINTRPLMINIAGAVQRPGLIQLQGINPAETNSGNTTSEIPTITSALTLAGGVTRNADIRQIVLRRSLSSGEFTTTTINLWDALWSENAPRTVVLQDGDTLFVPELADGETLDRRLLARSNVAPRTVRVRVVGEVKQPGEIEVPPDSSISTAVATAGGPTDEADLDDATFIRMQENGSIDRQEIDLSNLTDTYQIQEGDVVIIPRRGVFSVLDFATQLLNPLSALFNLIP